ncbi:unnamed protein product [Prunus armeniaca]|uniref:Uncharacterized protein n=1 Tax=Prunus armeniaca TaxID=36596 RepID=A0A6J5UMG4_PRUAR|nr:unnamed protein product [Prunus armeniaca]
MGGSELLELGVRSCWNRGTRKRREVNGWANAEEVSWSGLEGAMGSGSWLVTTTTGKVRTREVS